MKNIITPLLMVSLLALLQGCSINKIWVTEAAISQAQVNADVAACNNYARTGIDTTIKAPDEPKVYDTNCNGGGYGSVSCTTSERENPNSAANSIGYNLGKSIGNTIIASSRRKNCMRGKGYKLTKRDSPSLKPQAPRLVAAITSFSNLPEDIEGKSIHIAPFDQKNNSSLEWKTYKKKIEHGFEKAGFVILSEDVAAYIASIAYGINEKKDPSNNASVEFKRFFEVNIHQRGENTDLRVYEGKLVSTGSCGIINEVIDEIIEAFFMKFPKESGKVTVPGIYDC